MNQEIEKLDTYDKTKKWLEAHVHKNYFPRNPEFGILYELINRHPSKSEWKNQVPISFKISRSTGNGAIVLYTRFEGMSNYRIVSWVACAKGKLSKNQTPRDDNNNNNNNNNNKLNGAMRYAIRMQIKNYRKSHPTEKCELCGTGYRIEVDHYPKHFVEIKEEFIKVKEGKGELPPSDFKWHPKKGNFMFKDGTKANDYYDKKWKQAWQRYHQKHATYRYLCSTCNKKTNQIGSVGINDNGSETIKLELPKLEIIQQPVILKINS